MSSNPESRGLSLAHTIVDVLDQHKGEHILLLDLQGVCGFTDYFVICTGGSERTLRALAEEVVRRIKTEEEVFPRGQEGKAADGWILLDYGDVIAHLFSGERRNYYRLEDIWREGKVVLRVQ